MAEQLNHILMRNVSQVNQMNLNLLDSHDVHRIFTQVGCSKEKLLAALALMFMFPGVPCLYYGTEICMEGGYDPDSRRTFDWNMEHWDLQIMAKIKELIALKKEKIVQEGEVRIFFKGAILVIERKYNDTCLIVELNLSNQEQNLDEDISQSLIENGVRYHNVLVPYGYRISKR